MDQDTLRLGFTISLLAALISIGNIANAETNSQPTTTPSDTNFIGGTVARSAFTLTVVNREPKQKITQLNNNQRHIHYFSELKGMTGQTVSHRWLYNDQTMAELKFNVGAPRWRVWSSKTLLPDWTGEWSVAVIDEQGREVYRESFEYVENGVAVNQ